MSQISVRHFQEKDAQEVALLIKQLTDNIVSPNLLVNRLERLAQAVFGNFQCVSAEMDGRVIGFGELVHYPIASKGLVGVIEEVVVNEKDRKNGAGGEIIRRLLAETSKLNLKQLKLTAKPEAVGFYQRFGFEPRKDVVMVRKIY